MFRSRVPYRPRLLGVLAASIAIAVAGFGSQALLPSRSSRAAAQIPAPATSVTGPTLSPDLGLAAPDGVGGAVDPSIARLDSAIAAWTANLQADPADWLSAGNLAIVEYTRGRLTGSVDDYVRADEAAARALSVYPDDLGAQALHAVLRQSLHDFSAALALAKAIYAAHPDQAQALATVADAQLELGQYDRAAASLRDLEAKAPGAATTARLAHLAALQGDNAEAVSLAQRSVAEARAAGTDGPSLAWYEQLAGTLAFQAGRLGDAEAAFRAALTDWPASYAGLAGLGKTLAARGDYAGAIGQYERAVAIVPQPEYLAALSDLYELTGQTARSRQEADTVALAGRLATIQRQVYNRQIVLFDANHGIAPAEAVRQAQAEIAVRQDVYGWDALAWALLADGQPAAAHSAIQRALALGTQDALIEYHAGMIAAALGDRASARTYLRAALALNPGFDPIQARRARMTLAGLQ